MIHSNLINQDSLADLIFQLKWNSDDVTHTDTYQANRVNIWRDLLPPVLLEQLMDKETGDRLEFSFSAGEALEPFSRKNLRNLQNAQFDRRYRQKSIIEPRIGRFYPKGMLRGISGIYRADMQPFRCVGIDNGHLTVDFNHPMAGKDLRLSVVVGHVESKQNERGGTSVDWMESLTAGPGMQARWKNRPTDYFSENAFSRKDERPDAEFYRQPRLVRHIDDTARETVKNTYGRFLTDGMKVLDLMSSWESHIPQSIRLSRLVGLGLNHDELKKNPHLGEMLVHDLNEKPLLPFEANSFDAVVNTVSVEYLTDPLSVFREVSRILRPDGCFVVTFSNRWFPPKAIRIWEELHEFERMGLVLEYFLRSKGFKDLQTFSIRGVPRPHNDKYFPELFFSDPVYAVWGRKK